MKTSLHATALALAAGTALAGPALAETWRFNNFLPETRPESAQIEQFAEDVNTALADRDFEIEVYHGGSLGLPNTDLLRVVPTGAVEMSLMWANYLGRDAPALGSVFVQGAISTVDELLKVLPVAQEIYEEEYDEWGITTVGFVAIPTLSVSVFCRDEPVNTLEQLRDVKLRVWAREQVETFTNLGVAAQIIPQEETYVALRTGVVDCALYPALYASTISLQEVTEHAAFLYPMASAPYTIGVPDELWESTDPEIKSAITEAADALWERTNQYDADLENEMAAREALAEQGITWHDDFPEEDRALFIDAVSETWQMLAEEAGGNALDYRERVLTALGR
ncbi:putative solute-binding periplasmic protein [Oceanicola granulosus HTCC2516]|uniref:Putative solute-binding periplasmic protein n=1 Tax=Oceanicola granulosus (strain ATCC BAA-861 / DSM 15982 / KCTC 12143 / HTCC2516) TaxID=314256 RepID=Q2CF48_OCEGH|nr:TRAP transporter substrate-binding protein DctP [Oceanicola granulosus]EAR51279.1 putative solute-binding periplasmic protein [Oceanicola granulosus HTCC2516]